MATPIKPTLENITGLKCPNNRYLIADLAPFLQTMSPKFKASEYEAILKAENVYAVNESNYYQMGVTNSANDKDDKDGKPGSLSKLEREAGFTSAKDSISAGEAFGYWLNVCKIKKGVCDLDKMGLEGDIRAVTAINLYTTYFPGHPTREKKCAPADKGELTQIKFYSRRWNPRGGPCHDADTCTIGFFQKIYECFKKGFLTFYGSIRTSLIDAPEVGDIPDTAKPYVFMAINDPNFDFEKTPDEVKYKRKLIQSAITIYKAYVKDAYVSYDEAFAAVRTIAKWIDYDGTISAYIMNDFALYVQETMRAKFFTPDSTIRWTSADTPAHLCGIYQFFDTYLRGLATYTVEYQELIDGYLRDEFGKTIADADKLHTDYKDGKEFSIYKEKIAELAKPLKDSNNESIKALYNIFKPENLPKASEYYPPEERNKIFAAISAFLKVNPGAEKDWPLTQVLLGSVYAYIKYRNQFGGLYKKAMLDVAMKYGFGLWNKKNPTYTKLYEENLKNNRYDPDDCMEKLCGTSSIIISLLTSILPDPLAHLLYNPDLPCEASL